MLVVLAVSFGAVALFLEVLGTYGFIYEEFVPGPPVWPAILLYSVAGLVGPVAAVLQWRSARRDELESLETIVSTALIGGIVAVGGLVVLFFVWAFFFAFGGT
jgi:hypothetical protein